jgi:hypothetical protein
MQSAGVLNIVVADVAFLLSIVLETGLLQGIRIGMFAGLQVSDRF